MFPLKPRRFVVIFGCRNCHTDFQAEKDEGFPSSWSAKRWSWTNGTVPRSGSCHWRLEGYDLWWWWWWWWGGGGGGGGGGWNLSEAWQLLLLDVFFLRIDAYHAFFFGCPKWLVIVASKHQKNDYHELRKTLKLQHGTCGIESRN